MKKLLIGILAFLCMGTVFSDDSLNNALYTQHVMKDSSQALLLYEQYFKEKHDNASLQKAVEQYAALKKSLNETDFEDTMKKFNIDPSLYKKYLSSDAAHNSDSYDGIMKFTLSVRGKNTKLQKYIIGEKQFSLNTPIRFSAESAEISLNVSFSADISDTEKNGETTKNYSGTLSAQIEDQSYDKLFMNSRQITGSDGGLMIGEYWIQDSKEKRVVQYYLYFNIIDATSKYSCDFVNLSAADILMHFSAKSGMNISCPPYFKDRFMSLKVNNLNIYQIFEIIARQTGSQYVEKNGQRFFEPVALKDMKREQNYFINSVTREKIDTLLSEIDKNKYEVLEITADNRQKVKRLKILITDDAEPALRKALNQLNNRPIMASFKIFELKNGNEKLISSPRILTLEGQEASVKVGSDTDFLALYLTAKTDANGFYLADMQFKFRKTLDGVVNTRESKTTVRIENDYEQLIYDELGKPVLKIVMTLSAQ